MAIRNSKTNTNALPKVLAGAGAGLAAGFLLAGRNPWYTQSDTSRAIRVETDPISEIPEEADVVVIGGGISGISTALYLNEFGLKTVVFEKGSVANEASSRNFGWVYSNALAQELLPMAEQAKEHWFGFADRFGFDVTARRTGNFTLAPTEKELDQHREWLVMAQKAAPTIDAQVLNQAELEEKVPGVGKMFAGALYQPSDGMAEPSHAVPLIAKGARQEGVKIFERTAVRGFEYSGKAISKVVTEHGSIRTKKVVLAGGSWTSYFLNNLGINLPQQNIASSLLRFSGAKAGPGAAMGGDIFWRDELPGTVSIGTLQHIIPVEINSFKVLPAFAGSLKELLKDPLNVPLRISIGPDFINSLKRKRRWKNDEVTEFERVRMLTSRHIPAGHKKVFKALEEVFPDTKNAKVIERWGGSMDALPDSLPVLDQVDQVPGLYVNSGYAGEGFSVGPGGGHLMAEIVAGREPSIDPTPFRFSRFHDGSQLSI
ncbi:NAD(P)/FAD-dependent oxidoreductase [Corynebacterium lubricantis]|uniref:NAD(P)/FAD-dependent oxidoreductase n=1 Tax=Corynebacterium lubricantis TaxID=541095 RepID=UPI0003802009|nr:FAD-binding oxidoreductase [Corynebacterium lubricantis]